MNITCNNENCLEEFKLDITDFEVESSPSGSHTTQHLASGTVSCPVCKSEMEIKYLYDELNDTGEVLSEEII